MHRWAWRPVGSSGGPVTGLAPSAEHPLSPVNGGEPSTRAMRSRAHTMRGLHLLQRRRDRAPPGSL
jgi:hypothetical protein